MPVPSPFVALAADLDPNAERLARSLAPVIRFVANEPFLPSAVGVSFITSPGRAVAAPRQIAFEPGVARVIEYAIWWDWDIQHLYELEHVWLKLDDNDKLIGVAASRHGGLYDMRRTDGTLPLEDGRVTLYAEPGKHAFHPEAASMEPHRRALAGACSGTTLHGFSKGNILVNEMYPKGSADFSEDDHRRVRRYLQARAFSPDFDFSLKADLAHLPFASFETLQGHIARRVPEIVAELRATQPLIKTVFIDSGDTMVDEATETYETDGTVATARLIPGTLAALRALREEGYRLCLVADGRVKSFENVLGATGIQPLLEAEVISEALGCEKPDPRMLAAALEAMGLDASDAGDCVMIGNHLTRDIGGAKQAGIRTIWLDWSPRRAKQPASADEVPDFTLTTLAELPRLLEFIELQMAHDARRRRLAKGL